MCLLVQIYWYIACFFDIMKETSLGGDKVKKNNIIFWGEDNRTNNEVYQLLNWRFHVDYYTKLEDVVPESVCKSEPAAVVVSLIGTKVDFSALFKGIAREYPEIPVVTIGTVNESSSYEEFYETGRFYKILRPVTGKRVIDFCRFVISGMPEMDRSITAENAVGVNDIQPHILVVDDNALVLRHMKGILEEKYSVAVAASGFQAFVSIGKKKPDLILLDYDMPEMNGKEVMKKLQSDEELCDIPIVFLTGADSREIVMELLALKPAGYILKPAESEALFHKLEVIIGK